MYYCNQAKLYLHILIEIIKSLITAKSFKKIFLLGLILLIINVGNAADLYWIGNSGNWNEPSHWSISSGGSSCSLIPSSVDNVFFDAFSFDEEGGTINIQGQVQCKNFNATGLGRSVTFSSNKDAVIEVAGSFLLSNNCQFDFNGTLLFTSVSDQNVLQTAAQKLKCDLTFNGNNGTWTISDVLRTNESSIITLKRGTLNTNSKLVYCGSLICSGNFKKSLILGESQVVVNRDFDFSDSRKLKVDIGNSKIQINNAGSYIFKTGDVGLTNIILPSPLAVTIDSITTWNVLCNGNCTGAATVFHSGGVGPFGYNWQICGISGSPTCTNQCAGTYWVQVIDSGDGNNTATQFYSITEPPALLPLFQPPVNASCFDSCNGSATVNPIGGTTPYTYIWSNGDTDNTADSLCAGTYTVTVSDFNACDTFVSITINQPNKILPNVSGTNVDCFGNCSGSATANPTGGTPFNNPPYLYLWSTGATTQGITGLCIGTYYVTVTDSLGCLGFDSIDITEPPPLTFTKDSITVSCGGNCDGSAWVVVNGGTTPYTYIWNNSATTDTIFGLCAGIYCVTFTDSQGCQDSTCFNITEPNQLFSNPSGQDITCNGDCDGQVSASPTGGTTPYAYLWSSGCTTQICTGLCPGSYIVTVTDNNGCSNIDTVNITEPTILLANSSSTNALCNGDCNGTASTAPSGGTPGYSYLWSTGSTNSSINSLCAGTYTVTVTDNNGCTDVDTITITEPQILLANTSKNDVSCFGYCDGSATANPTGGTAPYSYTWVPTFATTPSITGLCPGQYIVSILDSNNCTVIDTVDIIEPPSLTVNTTFTDVLCNGDCNGSITANINGGTSPYSYSWSTGCTTQTCTSICAGVYTVTITDNNGCTATQTVTVSEPAVLDANISFNDGSCQGANDGSASSSPSGGTPGYTWLWSTGATTSGITGLSPGTYCVTVTDANGCTDTACINISEPSILILGGLSSDINCNGDCDGVASVSPSGGTTPYIYLWNNSATTASITGLCSGTYCVTITDDNGCTDDTCFTITEPTALLLSTTSDSASCDSVCDGQGTAIVSGGVSPYSYQWSTGNTNAIADSLCSGTYLVTVTDDNGCTQIDSVNIPSLVGVTISSTQVTVGCNDTCDGSATAFPSGGSSPYIYLWSDGQTNQTADSLCVGIYYVTVYDSIGCFAVDTVSVTALPVVFQVQDSALNVACNGGCNGEAWANASGGATPYTYLWNTSATTQGITGLCPGTYTCIVSDTNGCLDTISVIITEPLALSSGISKTDVICNGNCDGQVSVSPSGGTPGYTYLWNTGCTTATCTGLCPGNYYVTITDTNGCTLLDSITIVEPVILSGVSTTVNATCNGNCDGWANVVINGGVSPYSYLWSSGGTTDTETGLCSGSYTVTVTDANNCTYLTTVTINEPNVLNPNTSSIDASCNGNCDGVVSSTPTGGSGPYTYLWSSGCTTQNCTGLCSGVYTVTVTDFNGCTSVESVTINNPNVLSLSGTQNDVSCNGDCNGSATVNVSGGTTPYSFLWSDGQTNQTATGLCAGNYSVTVTDDNGCTDVLGPIAVNEPGLIIPTPSSIEATCGNCDGEVSVNPTTGGVPPYTYNWSSGCTDITCTGLCAGLYTVTITDFLGCDTIINVPLSNIGGPTGEIIATTDVTCHGGCDGTATVTPIGGTPPYTYLWISDGQTNQMATGLCAGTWFLQITDNTGCIKMTSATITEPDSIQANFVSSLPTCNGNCDGSISANPTGGTSPYTYSWSTGSSASTVSNLCSGIYTVTITDASACTEIQQVTLNEPNVILLTINATDAICDGSCDGDATVTVSGGTTPYSYSWSDGQSTQSATGLCAGIYSVTVTDNNGCSAVASTTISAPSVITETDVVVFSTCGQCDGSISVTPSGGTSPYNYTWSGNNPPNSAIFNLCSGVYDLTITDQNGCQGFFSFAVSDSGGPITTTTGTNVLCNGDCDGSATVVVLFGTSPYTYLWNDINAQTTSTATGLCAGTYFVEVTDNLGCVTVDTVVISEPLPILPNTSSNDVNCNGDCNGNALSSPTQGVVPYNYNWSTGATTQFINGLCTGTYTVTVTDNNGCTGEENVIITEPGALQANAGGTDAQCNGMCNGVATSTPSGGTAPYTFSWSTGASSQVVAALCPGTYTVTVTDNKGCTDVDSVIIGEPTTITDNASVTDATCGLCDGSIVLAPTGGSSPYTYYWTPNGETTSSITGLCAGAYNVTVTDNSGCTAVFSYIVVNIGGPTVTSSGVNATCFGSCDGTGSASASGGTTPYTYFWNPAGQTTTSVTGLCAGTYQIFVTDSNGCVGVDTLQISQPDPIQANIAITDALCFGDCNGSATTNPIGGNGPYTFLWSDAQTTQTATGLCAGTYTITITDNNGCTGTDIAIVNEPNGITANESSDDGNCNTSCDGLAQVNPAGGQAPYSYSWSTTETTQVITDLCIGTYTVTITDNNGCSTVAQVTVGEPNVLTVSSAGSNVNCNGSCDGSATASPSGGTTPYYYNWANSGQTTQIATGLCSGTHYVTVTDGHGCTAVDSVIVTQPTAINLDSAVITGATCGNADGDATAIISGGTSPYTYLWSNGQTNQSATGLAAGVYTITITDSNGCTSEYSVGISNINGPNVTLNLSGSSCNGDCDGQATASASGGQSPYTYQWSNGDTGTLADSLCAGLITVIVTDSNGCITIMTDTIDSSAVQLSSNLINVSCNGDCDGQATVIPSGGYSPYNYQWDSNAGNQTTQTATGLCTGSYNVTVTDSSGCVGIASVTVTEPSLLYSNLDSLFSAQCHNTDEGYIYITVGGGTTGYSYNWSGPNNYTSVSEDITDLYPGDYILIITDNNGCTDTLTATIDTADILLAVCDGDTSLCISPDSVLISGSFIGAGPVTYEWYDQTFILIGTSQTIAVLPSVGQNVYYYIIDDGTCKDTCGVFINVNPPPVIDAGDDDVIVSGNSSTLGGDPTGASGSTYQWSPSTSLDDSTAANPVATPSETTTYYLTVTNDSGCVAIDSVTIEVIPQIVFPNGFSPNGDGKNDTWVIDYIDRYPDALVEVYNRWGEMLFHSIGYKEEWDGIYKGKPLPVGTYYYIINLNHPDIPEPYTGPITIMR